MFSKLNNMTYLQKLVFAIGFVIVAAYTSVSIASGGSFATDYGACSSVDSCIGGAPLDVATYTNAHLNLLGAVTGGSAGISSVGVSHMNLHDKIGEALNDNKRHDAYKEAVNRAGEKFKMDPKSMAYDPNGKPKLAQDMKGLKKQLEEVATRTAQGLVGARHCSSTIENCEINYLAMGVKLGIIDTNSPGVRGAEQQVIGELEKEYAPERYYAGIGFFTSAAHAASAGGGCSDKIASTGSNGVGTWSANFNQGVLDLSTSSCGSVQKARTTAQLYQIEGTMPWIMEPGPGVDAKSPAAAAQVARGYQLGAKEAQVIYPKVYAMTVNTSYQGASDPVLAQAGTDQQTAGADGQSVNVVNPSLCETPNACTAAELGKQASSEGLATNEGGAAVGLADDNQDPAATGKAVNEALGKVGDDLADNSAHGGGDFGESSGGSSGGGTEMGQLYVPPKTLVSGLSLKEIFGPGGTPATMLSQNTR